MEKAQILVVVTYPAEKGLENNSNRNFIGLKLLRFLPLTKAASKLSIKNNINKAKNANSPKHWGKK